MTPNSLPLVLASVLAAGCTAVWRPTPLSERHPARAEAPHPAPVRVFDPLDVLPGTDARGAQTTPPASTEDASVEIARWTCPMHPEIVRDAPGECPECGMTLVPLHAELER